MFSTTIPTQDFTHEYTSDTELARIVLRHIGADEHVDIYAPGNEIQITVHADRGSFTIRARNIDELAARFRAEGLFSGEQKPYMPGRDHTVGRIHWQKAGAFFGS